MKRIAFIIPYFGHFNNYFQLWLNSCLYNPTIDWIIFTDDKAPYNYPKNVKVHYTNLNNIKRMFIKALGFDVYLDNAYKLCDYRPFFGEVFADYLEGYDFWGYCDVDLIWGDIRKFITDELLDKYDRIFEWGHCTLIRNEKKINRFYHLKCEGVVDYKEVCSNSFSYGYDENEQSGMIFQKYYPKSFFKGVFCFDILVEKKNFMPAPSMNKPAKKYIFAFNQGKLRGFYMEGGTLHSHEYLYVHLQKRHMFNKINNNTRNFLIVPNKFLNYKVVTKENFKQFLPTITFYWHNFKMQLKSFEYALFDNAPIQPYKRGHLSYFFDKLFRRNKHYKYWFKD